MAQYRQSGARDYDIHHHYSNSGPDPISIPVRPSHQPHKAARHRRLSRFDKGRRVSIGAVAFLFSLGLFFTVLAYYYLSRDSNGTDVNDSSVQEDNLKNDIDFLTNVTRTEPTKVLRFGKGSVAHGRDSRYWDKDDRRRDDDYDEDAVEHYKMGSGNGSTIKGQPLLKLKDVNKKYSLNESSQRVDHKAVGLYNEAGRNELKMYEAEYEASLKSSDIPNNETFKRNQLDGEGFGTSIEAIDTDDDYDSTDSSDSQTEETDDDDSSIEHCRESSEVFEVPIKAQNAEDTKKASREELTEEDTFSSRRADYIKKTTAGQATKRSKADTKRNSKRRSCEMKVLNSTAQLVEPLETRKFSRFSLQYIEKEEKPDRQPEWEPRFAGHQSLRERELSFLARDKKINCGFVKGPQGYPSTGFDLPENDLNYMSSCHIAVVSCIFGNSDRLRTPANKMITRLSRKNACFVMFVDDVTLRTLNSEGNMPDPMGFIGLWKIVVVKNLPFDDMRRVGKVPKFLSHRLFPSARYSIWLDSKLRLQLDPLLILEYFLWRKGHEYSISNHYDRHCVWEEVAQNKRLNKYNHTTIDEQFKFYQSDGLKRFNLSDPEKLLPSNVPEGSFIVRAHTPMSNLFSCLWFNEVDRFTSRDQLSFAYTYQKLRKMNPTKPFHLNMFKDCERRRVAKLFRHRSQEKRNTHEQATE